MQISVAKSRQAFGCKCEELYNYPPSIIEDNLYMFNFKQLARYGREYFYLLEQGYEYVNGRMVMRK